VGPALRRVVIRFLQRDAIGRLIVDAASSREGSKARDRSTILEFAHRREQCLPSMAITRHTMTDEQRAAGTHGIYSAEFVNPDGD
jgi:hypothetical protein